MQINIICKQDWHCTYKRNVKARSCNHCCHWIAAISITYFECVFLSLGIRMQCACAIFSSVSCPAVQYFSKLSHKRHGFRKDTERYWTWSVWFDFLHNFCLKNFHSENSARCGQKYIIGLHIKYPLIPWEINETRIFWANFGKILKYQISGKSVQ
jgi:hypothetical protein